MKTVIVGCGRVGATLAEVFDRAGHDVIVVDVLTRAFDRLPASFGGNAVRGDGTDEDTLRRAGAEEADIFLALTEGDNRNVMSAQVAVEELHAKQVIAKINDPLRAAAYADLGLATVCRTTLMTDAITAYLGMPVSGIPGINPPSGTHHGGEHHERVPAGARRAAPDATLTGSAPVGTSGAAAPVGGDGATASREA